MDDGLIENYAIISVVFYAIYKLLKSHAFFIFCLPDTLSLGNMCKP